MPEIQTPEWVKDAIFYQIFPDRFAKSDAVPKASGLQSWGAPPTPHGYQGGDLLGMAEHLSITKWKRSRLFSTAMSNPPLLTPLS